MLRGPYRACPDKTKQLRATLKKQWDSTAVWGALLGLTWQDGTIHHSKHKIVGQYNRQQHPAGVDYVVQPSGYNPGLYNCLRGPVWAKLTR